MSDYTADEREGVTSSLGPSGISFDSDDRDVNLREIHELLAWSFLANPDLIFSFGKMSVRKLKSLLLKFTAQLDTYVEALASIKNPSHAVTDTSYLESAAQAVTALTNAVQAGSTDDSASDSAQSNLSSYLDKQLAKTVKAGDGIRTPGTEASAQMVAALTEMESTYAVLLGLGTHLPTICTDWSSVNLRQHAGALALPKIQASLAALTESAGAAPRSETLELLGALATIKNVVNPQDPCASKVTGTGTASGTGTRARTPDSTNAAPYNLDPTKNKLKLNLNGEGDNTYTLPNSTRASIESETVQNSGALVFAGPAAAASLSTDDAAVFRFEKFSSQADITIAANGVDVADTNGAGSFAPIEAGDWLVPGSVHVNARQVASVTDADNLVLASATPAGLKVNYKVYDFRHTITVADGATPQNTESVAISLVYPVATSGDYTATGLALLWAAQTTFLSATAVGNVATLTPIDTTNKVNTQVTFTGSATVLDELFPAPLPRTSTGNSANNRLFISVRVTGVLSGIIFDVPPGTIPLDGNGGLVELLNANVVFNSKAVASAADDKLKIQSLGYGPDSSVKVRDSSIKALIAFPLETTETGADVTIQQIKASLAAVASFDDEAAVLETEGGKFYVESKEDGTTSSIVISDVAAEAYAVLGLVEATYRGSVDGWTDATAKFLRNKVRPKDHLIITDANDVEHVREIKTVDSETQLTLHTEVTNNWSYAYRVESKGWDHFQELETALNTWVADTLTTDDGFATDLSKLSEATAGAVQLVQTSIGSATRLSTNLNTILSALNTILNDTQFNPVMYPQAQDILDALEELGYQRMTVMLREARFSSLFATTAQTMTLAGEVMQGISELAVEDFPIPDDPRYTLAEGLPRETPPEYVDTDLLERDTDDFDEFEGLATLE